MAPYDVPTTQLDDYKSSIHWENLVEAGDLSSPVCNDCHGGHGPLSPEPGAAGRMCGECHFQIAEYFASSPHDSLFVSTDRPGCATCHGNHDIRAVDEESLTLGGRNACTEAGCHTGSDAGGVAAAAIGVLFDSLMSAHTRSDSILDAAERAGMLVDQARFELAQVQTAIVGVRALVHTVRLDSVRGKVEEGLVIADAGFVAGEDAFVELRTRRTGLAVSAAVILVLVVGLLIRIRELGVE